MTSVDAIGLGALIRIPSPLRPKDRKRNGVRLGTYEFEPTEMSEWLIERNVQFRVLTGDAEDKDEYFLFISDRKQAIAFVTQFGDATEHRTWYDEAASPDDDYEGIPRGWVKTSG